MKKSSWLFFLTLIISSMITLSANNWISMWIGLELNMMSFIPLILSKSNKSSSEAAMIYFLVQSMSSMILIMMILISMCKYLIYWNLINNIITISILIKLGAAPFHMWMPEIMSKMEWNKCSILMTWQKIAPLMMISNINNNSIIINAAIIWSIGIGSIGGINQTSLRKMLGYSSINHLGWLLAINKSMNLWMMYLLIYSIMIIMMCKLFMSYKMYFINQMSSPNMSNMEKISFFIMMMSMGGLPPFMGFLPKWITIQSMINEQEFMIIFIMIMFSLVTLMYYLRVMTNMYLSFNSSIKWSMTYNNKVMTMMILMLNLSLPMIMSLDIM
uniref:NADH-ubiquinone oxidoreductase chain 2 n=1 Tax=Hoplistodera incisa TaxID=2575656 RepID=A0A4D6X0P7_9HEMI|nr:NADH dehydrogenase subunit 2 [Hoplistodera incisa]QCI09196.1 NADH dehydrogenase subunit 2 [Hoplistodera incisa]